MRFCFAFLLMVGLCVPAHAQKQILPMVKAASGRVAQRTPKQILEQTRLFVRLNGRRPRNKIYAGVPFEQLTPAEQNEVRLAQRVTNLLTQARINPQKNTPTVKSLRALVEQFPNRKMLTTAQLLEQTHAFIKQHDRRPRNVICKNGNSLTLDKVSPQEQEELRLGMAIYRLFTKAKTNPQLNTPQLDELRRLLNQYSRKPRLAQTQHLPQQKIHPAVIRQLPQLLKDTQSFIEQHARRPKTVFYQNGVPLSNWELSAQQQIETKLGRALTAALTYANAHGLTQLQDIQTLHQLLAPYTQYKAPALSVSEILQETRTFLETNTHRPRTVFFDEQGERIPAKQLSPEQLYEFRLGTRISNIFSKFKQGKLEYEKETVEQLHQLVRAHPNLTTVVSKYEDPATWQEIINQVEEFVATHHRRPRNHVNESNVPLTNDELSPEELAEVQLGRKMTQALVKAKSTGQTEHPLIVRLRELSTQYTNKPSRNLPAIADQLEQFINIHHRRPRTVILKNRNTAQKLKNLSAQEQAEIRLGRQVYQLRRQTPQDPTLQQDPSVQKILQLLQDTTPQE